MGRGPKHLAAAQIGKGVRAGHLAMLSEAVHSFSGVVGGWRGLTDPQRAARKRGCHFMAYLGYLDKDSHGIFHITPEGRVVVDQYQALKKQHAAGQQAYGK